MFSISCLIKPKGTGSIIPFIFLTNVYNKIVSINPISKFSFFYDNLNILSISKSSWIFSSFSRFRNAPSNNPKRYLFMFSSFFVNGLNILNSPFLNIKLSRTVVTPNIFIDVSSFFFNIFAKDDYQIRDSFSYSKGRRQLDASEHSGQAFDE